VHDFIFLSYLDVILEHLLGNPVDALVDANPGLLQYLRVQVYQRHLVVRLGGHLQKEHKNYICLKVENNTSAPIGKADQICRMNFQPIVILRIIFWGSPGIAYLKSQLDALIYWRSDS
jgi:hypothetical protein